MAAHLAIGDCHAEVKDMTAHLAIGDCHAEVKDMTAHLAIGDCHVEVLASFVHTTETWRPIWQLATVMQRSRT
ncbi:hypothetical protein ACOMHN_003723 [Nucella lapillus]